MDKSYSSPIFGSNPGLYILCDWYDLCSWSMINVSKYVIHSINIIYSHISKADNPYTSRLVRHARAGVTTTHPDPPASTTLRFTGFLMVQKFINVWHIIAMTLIISPWLRQRLIDDNNLKCHYFVPRRVTIKKPVRW